MLNVPCVRSPNVAYPTIPNEIINKKDIVTAKCVTQFQIVWLAPSIESYNKNTL